MSRIAAFRFTLRPTAAQEELFRVIGGAARLGWNTALGITCEALKAREAGDEAARVPWTSIDLINAINQWRRSEFDGTEDWRKKIPAVVFEESVVDLARALKAFRDRAEGVTDGAPVGFPHFKKKGKSPYTFRIRNQLNNVRVGADGDLRSLRIPKIGDVRFREDSRKLRRLLRPGTDAEGDPTKPRGKITHVTVKQVGERWLAMVCVKLPDLHEALRHPPRPATEFGGFVGVDLGLIDYYVVGDQDGNELDRVPAPRFQRCRLEGERRRARAVTRRRKGSNRRKKAVKKLGDYHRKTAAIRRHEQHLLANRLVKNHDRLVLEDLTLKRMLANHKIALSLSDAALGAFVRILEYKAAWHGATLLKVDKFFPSTKLCSRCGIKNKRRPLSDRLYRCEGCGLEIDRDLNAAVNLARQGDVILASLGRGRAPDPGPGSTGPGHQRPSRGRARHRHPDAAVPAPATTGSRRGG